MGTYNALKYNVSFANAGGLVLLTTNTASSSSSLSFTAKIDSTYSEYIFFFNNIHPATDGANFTFNLSADGGSNFNVTKTTTFWYANHSEDNSATSLGYDGGTDLAQGTGYQIFVESLGADNDQSTSGMLHLFDPSNTTFVKHFMAVINNSISTDRTSNHFIAGYGNTTSAINAVDFKMSSGNIDSGTIKMFGVVK
jgi:hypothetical protein